MADPIIDDLADCMPDALLAQPVTLDGFGEPANNGPLETYPNCYVFCKNRVVLNSKGDAVTSTCNVIVGSTAARLNAEGYVYTLPARFSPRSRLRAISVDNVSDENGQHHPTVFFP